MANMLIDAGLDLTQTGLDGSAALHKAAASRWMSSTALKLARIEGVDINAKDAAGNTALHLACANDRAPHAHLVEAMLQLPNIEADAKNNDGETPFQIADGQGRQKIMSLLSMHLYGQSPRRGHTQTWKLEES